MGLKDTGEGADPPGLLCCVKRDNRIIKRQIPMIMSVSCYTGWLQAMMQSKVTREVKIVQLCAFVCRKVPKTFDHIHPVE